MTLQASALEYRIKQIVRYISASYMASGKHIMSTSASASADAMKGAIKSDPNNTTKSSSVGMFNKIAKKADQNEKESLGTLKPTVSELMNNNSKSNSSITTSLKKSVGVIPDISNTNSISSSHAFTTKLSALPTGVDRSVSYPSANVAVTNKAVIVPPAHTNVLISKLLQQAKLAAEQKSQVQSLLESRSVSAQPILSDLHAHSEKFHSNALSMNIHDGSHLVQKVQNVPSPRVLEQLSSAIGVPSSSSTSLSSGIPIVTNATPTTTVVGGNNVIHVHESVESAAGGGVGAKPSPNTTTVIPHSTMSAYSPLSMLMRRKALQHTNPSPLASTVAATAAAAVSDPSLSVVLPSNDSDSATNKVMSPAENNNNSTVDLTDA